MMRRFTFFFLVAIFMSSIGIAQNLTQADFTGLVVPQYMGSGTSTRLPIFFKATVSNLTANATYRYYTNLAISTDIGTTNSGAGNPLMFKADGSGFTYTSSTGLSTTGTNCETFTTDASGSYTGWFAVVNTGNARFTAGNVTYPSIVLNDGANGTVVSKRLCMSTGITVLAFAASAGANNGSFIQSTSSAAAKNIVALYDNTAGTGRPLAVTVVENIGTTIASLISGYSTTSGTWNTIIPNTNANGVRRIEHISISNSTLIGYATDDDGIWPTGSVNTVNPATGATAIVINNADAPLITLASSPSLNPASSATVDGTFDVTFTDDATWRAAISSITFDENTLPSGAYTVSDSKITFDPSQSAFLQTSKTANIVVKASGYTNATISQAIAAGVFSKDNSTVVSSGLNGQGKTATVTVTAKDKYNNPVSGYTCKYFVTVTNSNSTTNEVYTVNALDYSASISSAVALSATNASGVVTFDIKTPSAMDANDGVSVQVTDNSSNAFGSAIEYMYKSESISFNLQLLHSSDMEAGVDALTNAPNLIALVDTFRKQYPTNTLLVSGGDNYIPGPFFNASSDASLRTTLFQTAAAAKWGATGTTKLREALGRADILLMNIAGYDASALGNHDFDAGTSVLSEAIMVQTSGTELRWMGSNFPMLSCNLDFTGDANLTGLYTTDLKYTTDYATTPSMAYDATFRKKIAPYTIAMVNGEKVGIVGVTTQILESISSTGGVTVKGVNENNMDTLAAYVQPWVDALTNAGVNKIVILSHLQQIQYEKELIGKLKNVDIIVASGSHTRMADANDVLRTGETAAETYPFVTSDKNGKTALIVSTDGEWKYLGRLIVGFNDNGELVTSSLDDTKNGAYASNDATLTTLWGNTTKPFATGTLGANAKMVTDPIKAIILAQDGNIVGKTSVYLEGDRGKVRKEETNLGNLSAEANLWYGRLIDSNVKVSIKNGGGVRAAIGVVKVEGSSDPVYLPPVANADAGKAAGDISQLDIVNSLRFNNNLTILSVTASQLLQTMNHGVAASTATATPGQFPQVAGIRFSYDMNMPATQRVRSLVLVDDNGNTTDTIAKNFVVHGNPSRLIRLITLDFMTTGGDSYPFNTFISANLAQCDTINLKYRGTAITTDNVAFATKGSEQDAFAEFLKANYFTTAYGTAETAITKDTRIECMNYRSDDILTTSTLSSAVLPVKDQGTLVKMGNGTLVKNSGYGSAMVYDKNSGYFYLMTDRGPNIDGTVSDSKIFPKPQFTPAIGKFLVVGDSLQLVERITLKGHDGVTPTTGVVNPGNLTGETAYDTLGNTLATDTLAFDPEGLVRMSDGSFWISDEYGPFITHYDATGKMLRNLSPFATNSANKLPLVLGKRRANRGMEGLCVTPDEKYLVGIMQSSLYNPSSSGTKNKPQLRILRYNIATGATKQFVYLMEDGKNVVSEIQAIDTANFLVLERDQNFPGNPDEPAVYKAIYKINIDSKTTDISDTSATGKKYNGKTLEQLDNADSIYSYGIRPVGKVLVSDLLTDIPGLRHDKMEGLAILDSTHIMVANDDDFGINGNNGQVVAKNLFLPTTSTIDDNRVYNVALAKPLSQYNATYVPKPMTIAKARALGAGKYATVKGIVTNGSELGSIRYLQDNTAGVAAYSSAKMGAVAKGDTIIVTGTLKNYSNLLEFDPVVDVTVVNSGNDLPEPVKLKITDIAEQYEGMLVKLDSVSFAKEKQGRTIIKTSYSYGLRADSSVIYTSSTSVIGQTLPSGIVTITGIMSQYSSSNPASGYQLLPRKMDDFEFICSGVPVANAGADQLSVSGTSVTLAANAPASDMAAKWFNLDSASGSFGNRALYNSAFTGEKGKTYRLVWKLSNNCGMDMDTLTVSFACPLPVADAGEDQLSLTDAAVVLAANDPSTSETGTWCNLDSANVTGTFTDRHDAHTMFTPQLLTVTKSTKASATQTYHLVWTLTNECGSSSDTVVVSFDYSTGVSTAFGSLQVFPNPTQGAFKITSTSAQVISYSVATTEGEVVTKGTFSGSVELTLANKGVYMVTIQQGAQILIKKVVVY